MIVDSNVIVHLIRNDIPQQTKLATIFFKSVDLGDEVAEISILVIDEVIWVLGQYYTLNRADFIPLLLKLLALRRLKIIETDKEIVVDILHEMLKKNIDFTDLYLKAIAGQKKIFSFDKDLSK